MDIKDMAVPVLKCCGTHYEVGVQIGEAFKVMIQDLLSDWKYFESVLKAGSTRHGKVMIENSLKLCISKFPGYVDEVRGMAFGADIEFEKLFMLNIDSILCTGMTSGSDKDIVKEVEKIGGTGCTTILCNKDEVILGHTEDALTEIKDHVYIIDAEIVSEDRKTVIEKFTTLCYAGTLMGYTMGYNNHGMIYSVNTIFPNVCTAGTPRAFIARALLGASDLSSLIDILKDKGNGVADGFSVNVCFYPKWNNDSNNINSEVATSRPNVMFYNIEVAPATNPDGDESILDIHEIHPGSSYSHCNRYLRICSPECNRIAVKFSDMRHTAICRHSEPSCIENIKAVLSDQTDFDYPIYNDGKEDNKPYVMSFVRTVAVGIFNVHQKTWSVFAGPPINEDPIHIFHLP